MMLEGKLSERRGRERGRKEEHGRKLKNNFKMI
jgi:hypothetical protein